MNKKNTLNIYDFLRENHYKQYICPNIQRDFVWKEKQVTQLFDSINKGLFIGYLLFWDPQNKSLLKDIGYFPLPKEIDHNLLTYPENPRKKKLIGILDGQQRLSSLIFGTWGTWDSKKLCFDGQKFQFQIWPPKRSAKSTNTWLPVQEILFGKVNLTLEQEKFKKTIQKYEIPFYTLNHNDIDTILQIFRRINKAGTPLSNAQELLSGVALNWKDGRNKLKQLVAEVKIYDISISYDFIVKSYLFCTNKSLKISNISRKENPINGISKEETWNNLHNAIIETASLVHSLDFSDSTIVSYNAFIPIVYLYFHKCKPTTGNIRKYLYISFFKGVFGKASDDQLTKIREIIKKDGIEGVLKLEDFKFDDEEIEKVLNFKKGKLTKTALQFLYGAPSKDKDDDHMHPRAIISDNKRFLEEVRKEKNNAANQSFFNKEQNKNIEKILKKNWKHIFEKCDKLPNLQPLSRKLNHIKLTASLIDWVDNMQSWPMFVNQSTSLLLSNFENFFNERREKMRKKLKELINK